MEAPTTINAKLAKAAKILFVIVLQTSDFRLQTSNLLDRRSSIFSQPRVAVVHEAAAIDRHGGRHTIVQRRQKPQRVLHPNRFAVVDERRALEEDVVDAAEIAADGCGLQKREAAAVGEITCRRLAVALIRKQLVDRERTDGA